MKHEIATETRRQYELTSTERRGLSHTPPVRPMYTGTRNKAN